MILYFVLKVNSHFAMVVNDESTLAEAAQFAPGQLVQKVVEVVSFLFMLLLTQFQSNLELAYQFALSEGKVYQKVSVPCIESVLDSDYAYLFI